MENNKQLGPLYQMETFSNSAQTSPPMHYNNGSEAVTVHDSFTAWFQGR